MGAVCGRRTGADEAPRGSGARHKRHRGSRHKKSASQRDGEGAVVPAPSRIAVTGAVMTSADCPPSPRGAKPASAAPAAAPRAEAAVKPSLHHDGGCGSGAAASSAVAHLDCTAALTRSASLMDVFYDAAEAFDERDASPLAEAPYAFARHALCDAPPGAGHVCVGASADARAQAAAAAAAAADGEVAADPPGKSTEVEELERLGKQFADEFWAGKGSLAGRGLKTLQALRHMKDVDLSRFGGVPISHHLPVSGSQMLHANTFMPGRVPPATRLDAHLRAELPAALRAEPLERFLVVLRAHIALLDAPAHSLRKPFNPVLGETSRLLHFVEPNAPPIAAVCEQVSHHPPVTAFASYDAYLRCSYTGWVDIAPRFMGLAIRVPMTGQRELTLTLPPGNAERDEEAPMRLEHYRATIPAMEWHFLPAVRAEYSGTWCLWCEETGFAAEITHPTKSFMGLVGRPNRIEGRLTRRVRAGSVVATGDSSPKRRRGTMGSSATFEQELLFTFDGEFDGCVWLRPASRGGRERGVGAPRLLWDASSAARLESSVPPPQSQPELEARSADAVWGAVFRAMHEGAWDEARAGKEAVEVAERVARRERAARGERWTPTWFERDTHTGGWKPRA